MITSTLRERFNTAAQLFTDGQIREALEAYESIFTPDNENEMETPSEAFSLEIRMRIAFCLIELGEYSDARCQFEAETTRNLLMFAGPVQLEAYFFAYGNLLAKTGNYEAADKVLSQALEIGYSSLEDAHAVDRICRFRLHWANHYSQWANLLELAQEFRELAQKQGLLGLMHWSTEAMCFALRGLHQYAEAKQGAEQICTRLQNNGARAEHIAVWKKFIVDLSA